MKCELDGNALCIKRENFENLQESPAMFIELTGSQLSEFKRLSDTEFCIRCGRYVGDAETDGLCIDCRKLNDLNCVEDSNDKKTN